MTASPSSRPFALRDMAAPDLPGAHTLSQAVDWPHRLEDWQFAHALGQGLVAASGDKVLGTAMWWSHDGKVAKLGMVIVDPAVHRSGIGRALMQGVLERITVPTVLLNATPEGEPLYRRLGFQEFGSIVQHQSAAFSVPHAPLRPSERIRPLGEGDLSKIMALDAAAGGARRENVIAALVACGEAVVLDDAGSVVGFAVRRRFGRGHFIGPVVARDADGAKALIAHWIGESTGSFVRIDVPGDCRLSDWLEQTGFACVDIVVSMVLGPPLSRAGAFNVFGVVNQALG